MLGVASPAQATIKVLATTADWGALATELGGDKVNVYTATNALQDVHQVDAKPSLVARARTADLVVANGAELEIGWLPVLLQESGNSKIQPGTPGYFEATSAVRLMDIPTSVDRSMGDIHPLGNPHIQLDPRNMARSRQGADGAARVARCGERRLLPGARRGLPGSLAAGDGALGGSGRAAQGRAGRRDPRGPGYLAAGSDLTSSQPSSPSPACRRAPDISPDLVTKLSANRPQMILRNAYNDPKAAEWLSQKSRRAGRDAAVLGGRDAGGEGPVRSLRRHPARACWRPGNDRHPRRTWASSGRRSSPASSCPCRTCRSASRCCGEASCSSTWRSPRSRRSA